MYNIKEEQKFDFFKSLYAEHFDKYEAQHYAEEYRPNNQLKFILHYMKQDDYAKAYNDLLIEQRER